MASLNWFRSFTSTPQATPVIEAAVVLPVATPVEGNVVHSGASASDSASESATATSPSTLTLTLTTECTHYPSSATDVVVGVNIQAPSAPGDDERAAVECVVVSDVSGSMAGAKMNLMRETGKLLLGEFVERDKVGLVTFDTDVSERLGLTSMTQEARTRATVVLNSFAPGSQTNLSGGCFAGIQQLLDHSRVSKSSLNSVKTVLLMTDGQANHGLRKASDIVTVLETMLKGSGISLHCFGYGSDHDSALLKALSTAGNGSYYFVEGVDDIRGAFGDCLGGILSVVAQNLELVIEATNGATITKVHHLKAVCIEGGTRYRVPFADLYGEEQRDVLVSLKLPARSPVDDPGSPEAQFLRCTLRFIDVIGKKPVTLEASAGVVRTEGAVHESLQAKNPRVELQASRLRVAETLEAARALGERGDLLGARQEIAAGRAQLLAVKARCAGAAEANAMLDVFDGDLQECGEGLVDARAYSSARHKMMNLSYQHQEQRCMVSAVTQQDFGGQVEKKSAYRTSAKSKASSKFAF